MESEAQLQQARRSAVPRLHLPLLLSTQERLQELEHRQKNLLIPHL